MRRCTWATASNAASIATWTGPGRSPAAAISTNVPSSGRPRRASVQAGLIDRKHAPDPLGDVVGGERGPGDVADVAVDGERVVGGLADELLEPAPAVDLAAVGLAVLHDLDPPHAPVRFERHRVVDDQVLTGHVVDDEEADEAILEEGPPDLLAAGPHLLARAPLDRGHVRGLEDHVSLHEAGRGGEGELLGLL